MAFKEIISGPFEVWIAPVGTVFPTLGAEPGDLWQKIGKSGAANYGSGGVRLIHTAASVTSVAAGRSQTEHAFVPAEERRVQFEMIDLRPQAIETALGLPAPARSAPDASGLVSWAQGLSRAGRNSPLVALMLRGPSPYSEGRSAQFEIARAFRSGQFSPVFGRGQTAVVAVEFIALRDRAAASAQEAFGRFVAGEEVALIELDGSDQSGALGFDGSQQSGTFEQE